VKTDSPQLGHLLEQVIDAAAQLAKPRRIRGRDTRTRRPGTFVIVVSAHGS